jgi:hypothetical protein
MPGQLPAGLWPRVHALAGGGGWPPADPAAFVQTTITHGLLPLLLAQADEVPEEVRTELRAHALWGKVFRRRAQTVDEARRRLPGLLGGIPYIVLKGADYARRLYPEPSLRPMQDLDILVRVEDFEAACAKLTEAGLERQYVYSPSHRVWWFAEAVFDMGEVTLEVHHSFISRYRNPVDYDGLWDRRVATGPTEARLDDVDATVYHALSLAKDEFFARLVRYVDLWLLLDQAPEPARLVERAATWRARRALFGTLHLGAAVWPDLAASWAGTSEQLLSPRGRALVAQYVLPGVVMGEARSRAPQLWRKFWLIEGSGLRLRFAAEWVVAAVLGRWLERRSL